MDKLGDTVRVTAHEIDEKLSPYKTSLANFLKSGFSKLNSVIRFEQVANQTDDVVQTAVNTTSEVTVPDDPAVRMMIGKLLSTGLSLVVSIGLSYFLVKLLSNALDPTRKEKSAAQQKAAMMLQRLGVTDVKLSDYELCIAVNLVDPVSMGITWDDIGGLKDVIEQIKETVIFPFRRRELFLHSKLLQPPKGMLLYGPPGCGKTMIAKATAKAAGCRFINLQISSLVDKWYGESQKRAEAVFSLAVKLQPAIIFVDEIDSFLRSRSSTDHEATAMIKTQFMSLWDGIITDPNCQIMIVGATNRPQDVDAAILRRMPCQFKIGKPAKEQRKHIMNIILEEEQVADIDLNKLGDLTDGFSGSDLKEGCRQAALYRVHEVLEAHRNLHGVDAFEIPTSDLRDMNMSDLEYGINQVKDSKELMAGSLSYPLLD